MDAEQIKEQEEKEAQPVDSTTQEDEDMASEFEETLKILDYPDKYKLMKIDDKLKREYMQYLE